MAGYKALSVPDGRPHYKADNTRTHVENLLFGYESGYLSADTYKAEITTYPLSTQELPTPAVMFFTTFNQGMVYLKVLVKEYPKMHCLWSSQALSVKDTCSR